MLVGLIKVGHCDKLTHDALVGSLGLNGSLTEFTRKVQNILGNNYALIYTLALTEEEVEKQIYHEIRVNPLGPLRADALFAYLSRELDNNRAAI